MAGDVPDGPRKGIMKKKSIDQTPFNICGGNAEEERRIYCEEKEYKLLTFQRKNRIFNVSLSINKS